MEDWLYNSTAWIIVLSSNPFQDGTVAQFSISIGKGVGGKYPSVREVKIIFCFLWKSRGINHLKVARDISRSLKKMFKHDGKKKCRMTSFKRFEDFQCWKRRTLSNVHYIHNTQNFILAVIAVLPRTLKPSMINVLISSALQFINKFTSDL